MSVFHTIQEVIISGSLFFQDYDAMVSLVDDVNAVPNNNVKDTPAAQHLYAFALNRYSLSFILH